MVGYPRDSLASCLNENISQLIMQQMICIYLDLLQI